MEQYKHFWDYQGQICPCETTASISLEGAIKSYWQEEYGTSKYHHTLIWDESKGTCRIINIEDEIAERDEEIRNSIELHENWG